MGRAVIAFFLFYRERTWAMTGWVTSGGRAGAGETAPQLRVLLFQRTRVWFLAPHWIANYLQLQLQGSDSLFWPLMTDKHTHIHINKISWRRKGKKFKPKWKPGTVSPRECSTLPKPITFSWTHRPQNLSNLQGHWCGLVGRVLAWHAWGPRLNP